MDQPDRELSADDALNDSLVAYLDGELDSAEVARVELRLGQDASYRQKLRDLQRSWDLLDLLPRCDVSESFRSATVEMAVVIADQHGRDFESRRGYRRWVLGCVGALSCAVSAVVSYAAVTRLAGSGDLELVRDVSIIVHLDALTHGGSVAFLEALDQLGLFAEDTLVSQERMATTAELESKSQRQRRSWLADRTPAEKLELASRERRFRNLSADQRQQLGDLLQGLQAHPRKAELTRVMFRYSDWLYSLPATQRFALLEEQPEQRGERIRRLVDRQRFDRLRAVNLNAPDVHVLLEWSRRLIRARRARILELLPRPPRRRYDSLTDETRQLDFLFRFYLQPHLKLPRRHPELMPSRVEFQGLYGRLSDRARRSLREAGSPYQQLRRLDQWVRAFRGRGGDPAGSRPIPRGALERFYDEELSPRERERLDRFRGRRFREQLRERYLNHQTRPRKGGGLGPPSGVDRPRGPRPRPRLRAGERPPPSRDPE